MRWKKFARFCWRKGELEKLNQPAKFNFARRSSSTSSYCFCTRTHPPECILSVQKPTNENILFKMFYVHYISSISLEITHLLGFNRHVSFWRLLIQDAVDNSYKKQIFDVISIGDLVLRKKTFFYYNEFPGLICY